MANCGCGKLRLAPKGAHALPKTSSERPALSVNIRDMRNSYLAIALLSASLVSGGLFSRHADAAVVRRAELPELVSLSAIAVHALVSRTHSNAADGFFTTIELEVLTPLKGISPDQQILSIRVPGGVQGSHHMRLLGAPDLLPGDEVVLLLEKTRPGHYVFTGLSQGVYFVLRGRKQVLVARDLGLLTLVQQGSGGLEEGQNATQVDQLPDLLDAIRKLVEATP